MGKISRTKGRRWEREVAKLLRNSLRRPFVVTLTESRDGNVGDIQSDLPITIQCRVGKSPSVWKALESAEEARGDNRWVMGMVRRNQTTSHGKADIAVLPLQDLVDLLRLAIRSMDGLTGKS